MRKVYQFGMHVITSQIKTFQMKPRSVTFMLTVDFLNLVATKVISVIYCYELLQPIFF